MNRRGLLESVVATAALSGVAAGAQGIGQATPSTVGPRDSRHRATPFAFASDGTALFHRDWGSGTPVVFLAPWGLHSDWWEYQMAYLSDHGLRCVSCDRRGHGRSTEAVAGYDFDTLADDLNEVIERLDLRGITLIAQSLGSGEIVRYLSRHGAGRVRRVVLVAPITPFLMKTADNPDGIDPTYFEKVRQALRHGRPNVIASAAPAFFGAPKNAVSSEMMQWWTNMLLDCPLKVLLDLHRVFTQTDFRAECRAIALPTLIIHGDQDTSAPIALTGRKTAALIRGSELKVYEGAAHGLTMTHTERLNADLLAFVRA